MSLAELLRAHRTDASMTIEMLAERSAISDRTISDIERGVSRSPQQRTLQALAAALQLDPDDARALHRAARVRSAPPEDVDRVTAIAPALVPDFTGRQVEVDAVAEYLRTVDPADRATRVVVVCGSPGIGKTTAAVEAIRRTDVSRPRHFVDLAGLGGVPLTALQIFRSLLQQAGVVATPPRTVDQAAAAWRQQCELRTASILLDNAGAEEQVRPVIASSVGCSVIVTARRSLSGLEGTFRVTLRPLDHAESTQLLGRIIPAAQRTDADLTELARLCGDVPLALRIAGNRIASQPAWTAADFVTRMRHEERRLKALTAGDLGVAAAFASSYDELDPELRDLYRTLSLAEQPEFDARLAAALIPTELRHTEDLLDELTDLGLLEARGSARFHMHDLAKLFAADRLTSETTTEVADTRRTNLRHWLVTSAGNAGLMFEPLKPGRHDSPGPGLSFTDPDSARGWLRSEADSWWAAFRRTADLGEHAAVVELAESLHWFSDLWGSWGHWHELFSLAAAAAIALGDPAAEAAQWGYVAWADIAELTDFEAAEQDALRSVAAADRSGDPGQQGWARFYLGWARALSGAVDRSIDDAQQALRFFAAAGDREGVLQSTALLADSYHRQGGPERAIEAHHALLDQLALEAGSIPPLIETFTRSSAEQLLAQEYLSTGRIDDAITWAASSLSADRQIGYDFGVVMNILTLARAHAAKGDATTATTLLTEAQQLSVLHSLTTAGPYLDAAREAVRRLIATD